MLHFCHCVCHSSVCLFESDVTYYSSQGSPCTLFSVPQNLSCCPPISFLEIRHADETKKGASFTGVLVWQNIVDILWEKRVHQRMEIHGKRKMRKS